MHAGRLGRGPDLRHRLAHRRGVVHLVEQPRRLFLLRGGSSLLEGLTDLAESVFNQPARLGKPQGIGGLVDVVNNPMYATGVGLVLFGAKHQSENKFRIRDENIFNRVIKRMKKWFSDVV